MKIAVLSISCPPGDLEGQISFPNFRQYCDRHGYAFRPVTCNPSNRNPSWGKIPSVLALLDEFEYVFCIDSDALITNPTLELESIVRRGEADLYITKEVTPSGTMTVQCGAFIARNTAKLREWFELTWAEFPAWGPWWEQSAMVALIGRGVDRQCGVKIHYVPERLLNSFPINWKPGNFVCHWAGYPNRVPLMHGRMEAMRAGIGMTPLRDPRAIIRCNNP